jgi:hypothetical protein
MLDDNLDNIPATRVPRRARLPADQSTLLDELRKFHEATGKLLEVMELYLSAYDSLSNLHARGLDHFIVTMYQELQDAPLAPQPYQHFSMIVEQLRRAIIWLYSVANTVEHKSVSLAPSQEYLDALFASMKTEPFLPVVKPQAKGNGHKPKRGSKKRGESHDESA